MVPNHSLGFTPQECSATASECKMLAGVNAGVECRNERASNVFGKRKVMKIRIMMQE